MLLKSSRTLQSSSRTLESTEDSSTQGTVPRAAEAVGQQLWGRFHDSKGSETKTRNTPGPSGGSSRGEMEAEGWREDSRGEKGFRALTSERGRQGQSGSVGQRKRSMERDQRYEKQMWENRRQIQKREQLSRDAVQGQCCGQPEETS